MMKATIMHGAIKKGTAIVRTVDTTRVVVVAVDSADETLQGLVGRTLTNVGQADGAYIVPSAYSAFAPLDLYIQDERKKE